jgi:hypothetical protein
MQTLKTLYMFPNDIVQMFLKSGSIVAKLNVSRRLQCKYILLAFQ